MMNIGLLGVGARGSGLAKGVLETGLAEISRAYDNNEDFARAFLARRQLDIPLARNRKEILDDPTIAAVLIATPDYCHADDVITAMESGKPVFCEKPMAISIADCDKMLLCRKKTGIPLQIGFNLRFNALYQAMQDIVQSGEIGRLTSVWVRHFVGHGGISYFQDWHATRAKAKTLLLQKASHDIDQIHFIAGQYARRVLGLGNRVYFGGTHPNGLCCPQCTERWQCPEAAIHPQESRNQCAFRKEIDVEDNEMVLMELEGGVLANYSQCEFTPDCHRSYVFIGTKGRIESFEPQSRRGEWQKETRLELLFRGTSPSRTYRFSHQMEGGHGGADPVMMRTWLLNLKEGKLDAENIIAGRQSVAVGCLAAESIRTDQLWRVIPPLP